MADQDNTELLREQLQQLGFAAQVSDALEAHAPLFAQDESPSAWAAAFTGTLAAAFAALHTAFFMAEPAGQQPVKALQLLALQGAGTAAQQAAQQRFAPGEGLPGQALMAGKSLLFERVPVPVASALGVATAECFFAEVPLLHRGQCLGVLEMARTQPFKTYEWEVLEKSARKIAFFISLHQQAAAAQAAQIAANTAQEVAPIAFTAWPAPATDELEALRQNLAHANDKLDIAHRIIRNYEQQLRGQAADALPVAVPPASDLLAEYEHRWQQQQGAHLQEVENLRQQVAEAQSQARQHQQQGQQMALQVDNLTQQLAQAEQRAEAQQQAQARAQAEQWEAQQQAQLQANLQADQLAAQVLQTQNALAQQAEQLRQANLLTAQQAEQIEALHIENRGIQKENKTQAAELQLLADQLKTAHQSLAEQQFALQKAHKTIARQEEQLAEAQQQVQQQAEAYEERIKNLSYVRRPAPDKVQALETALAQAQQLAETQQAEAQATAQQMAQLAAQYAQAQQTIAALQQQAPPPHTGQEVKALEEALAQTQQQADEHRATAHQLALLASDYEQALHQARRTIAALQQQAPPTPDNSAQEAEMAALRQQLAQAKREGEQGATEAEARALARQEAELAAQKAQFVALYEQVAAEMQALQKQHDKAQRQAENLEQQVHYLNAIMQGKETQLAQMQAAINDRERTITDATDLAAEYGRQLQRAREEMRMLATEIDMLKTARYR